MTLDSEENTSSSLEPEGTLEEKDASILAFEAQKFQHWISTRTLY
jgi:hypothetical protein